MTWHTLSAFGKRYLEKCTKAAIRVQQRWRGIVGRREFDVAKVAAATLARKQEECAGRLQNVFRGQIARRKAAERRAQVKSEELERRVRL